MSTSAPAHRLRRRIIPVVALAAAGSIGGVVALSGCGSSASAGSAPASIAGYIPARSPLYIQISTDTSGAQWANLTRLATLFPGFGEIQAEIETTLAGEGVDWDTDLKPLLGDAAAIALTEITDMTSAPLADGGGAVRAAPAEAAGLALVAVLQIAPGKADDVEALLAAGPGGMEKTGTRDGAVMYGDVTAGVHAAVTEESLVAGPSIAAVTAALDAHAAGGDAALSGVVRFNEALALLPDDVFALAYVNLDEAGKAAKEMVPQVGTLADGQMGGAAAMSVTAEPDGLRIKAVLLDAPLAIDLKPFTPSLVAQAPADTVAFLGFSRLDDIVAAVVSGASTGGSDGTRTQIGAITGQLPALLGVSEAGLSNLAGGEQAVVVTDARPTPGVALALTVVDGPQAATSLTALATSVPALARQVGVGTLAIGTATPFSESGVTGQVIPVGDSGWSVAWGVRGNLAAIGSGAGTVADVLAPRSRAQSLAGTAGFTAATQGMPDTVTALAYVDMRKVMTLLAANGVFTGADGARVRANLAPFTRIAAWSTAGATPTVEVVVGIGR